MRELRFEVNATFNAAAADELHGASRFIFPSTKACRLLSCRISAPTVSSVRVKITRQPQGSIDGIQLDNFIVGFSYEVGTLLGCYLLADGLAVPDDDSTRAAQVRTQVRFDVRKGYAARSAPILRRSITGSAHDVSQAAERPAKRRKRR